MRISDWSSDVCSSDLLPTTASAGGDQVVCGTSATLAATAATTGTGMWTVTSGAGGSFVNINSPTTIFNGVAGSVYELTWTITNGTCTSADAVQITLQSTPLADAGVDQQLCGTTAILAANTPTPGTGMWTITSGSGGSFDNASSPTATFTGTAGVTYKLKWTITSACPT